MTPRDLLRAAAAGWAAFRGALDAPGFRAPIDTAEVLDLAAAHLAHRAAAPKAAKTARTLSPRVLELLRQIGFPAAEFHRTGRGPGSARAFAARCAVARALRAEGLTYAQIAAACAVDPATARGYLRGATPAP